MPTLIQELAKRGLLAKDKVSVLEFEVKTSKRQEEEIILEKNIVPEEVLFKIKSEILKIPLKKVIPEDVPLKVLELISQESAKYYRIIPLGKTDNTVEIGIVYPEDLKTQEALKFLARQGGFEYRVNLITLTDFNNIFKQYQTLKREVTKALEELETEIRAEKGKAPPIKEAEFERLVEEAPISKVVAVLLRHAVEGKASDIHIEPTTDKTQIRFRLDGILHASLFLPKKNHPAIVARIKIISNLKIDETRIPQDGRFSANFDGKKVDFRVSTFPTVNGEKVVMRILDPMIGLRPLEELGLESRNYRVVKKAIEKPFGMILVTGPTASGKTTTLYAMLQILNKEGVNVITLEDPVEYYIEGMNQSQIRPEIGYTFAVGLRHILRQDPNIVMVGEMRDPESAALAIQAALTGQIVLSTLHTNDAIGVIPRLIDLQVAPFLIPSAMSVALSQRLVRRLCSECKNKIKPPAKIKDLILKEIESLPPVIKKDVNILKDFAIWDQRGCRKCRQTGYSGRIGIFEVLEMTDELAEVIMKEPTESKIREEAKRQGMTTMRQDGILKVLDGVTSINEVLRVTEEKE